MENTTAQNIPNYIRTETWSYTNEQGETETYPRDIIALEITFGRETRTIEFAVTCYRENEYGAWNVTDFYARVGNGEKSHACRAVAWLEDGKWVFRKTTTVLNRQAYIIGFRDKVRDTFKSQHNGSKIAKEVK